MCVSVCVRVGGVKSQGEIKFLPLLSGMSTMCREQGSAAGCQLSPHLGSEPLRLLIAQGCARCPVLWQLVSWMLLPLRESVVQFSCFYI